MIAKSSPEIINNLALHGILGHLAKLESEIKFVEDFQLTDAYTPITDAEALKVLAQKFNLKDEESVKAWRKERHLESSDVSFLKYAHFCAKRMQVVSSLLAGTGETLYLRYKDKLDRVLYRLIRVESEDFANHLYYSIDSGEIDFGLTAETHSCGPESKTQGLIGPVDLTTPHPEVSARLKTANPGQIFEPFKADEWYAIIKLEYRYESEFDEKTKEFLGGLLLGSKSKELIEIIKDEYALLT